ncbi:MAG TPA: FkbM family methyltransferase [Vicinamibacterales bacterium]
MKTLVNRALLFAVMLVIALGSAYVGLRVGRQMERNIQCCQVFRQRNLLLSLRETLGLAPPFYSQIGQDKWVLERMFPGERHGFFLDVGSGDGTQLSNSKALEERGWTGLCVDPFPKNMDGRTCRMFKAVVFSEPGRTLRFHAAGDTGGLADTLGALKESAVTAPTVELTTTTLQAILQEAKAPDLIHFVSLDIEGAELEALKAFPFEKHRIGAMAVEHNFEEPKRTDIQTLMQRHGYRRVHSWQQDDFYAPVGSK